MSGKLRIIGGAWRGRRLQVPERPGLRPSGDRVRETLFNWLQGWLPGARCLDLFAGSGALGLEAASRGAHSVTLIERDRVLAGRLRAIATDWPGAEVLDVHAADALAWLEHSAESFDLVFVDPPFDAGLYARTLALLARPGVLAHDARVYVESRARDPAPAGAATPDNQPSPAPCLATSLDDTAARWAVPREKRVGEVRMQLLAPARPESPADRSV